MIGMLPDPYTYEYAEYLFTFPALGKEIRYYKQTIVDGDNTIMYWSKDALSSIKARNRGRLPQISHITHIEVEQDD